jgi:hypothetical protein
LLSAWSTVLFALSSIGILFTSNHTLYDKYESAATNNPTTIADSLISFLIAYPRTNNSEIKWLCIKA